MADRLYIDFEKMEEFSGGLTSANGGVESKVLSPYDTATTLSVNSSIHNTFGLQNGVIAILKQATTTEAANIYEVGAVYGDFDSNIASGYC